MINILVGLNWFRKQLISLQIKGKFKFYWHWQSVIDWPKKQRISRMPEMSLTFEMVGIPSGDFVNLLNSFNCLILAYLSNQPAFWDFEACSPKIESFKHCPRSRLSHRLYSLFLRHFLTPLPRMSFKSNLCYTLDYWLYWIKNGKMIS